MHYDTRRIIKERIFFKIKNLVAFSNLNTSNFFLMVDTFILEVQKVAYWIRQEISQKIDITIGEIGLKY